jgi:fructose transport system permease protein
VAVPSCAARDFDAMTSPTETKGPTGPAAYERVLETSDRSVASFEESKGLVRRLQHFLHSNPTTIPLLVLLLSIAIFSVWVGGRFFAPFNLSLILQQVTIIAIVGIAQTLVILTAGIDLSVGAILVLSHVVMGKLAIDAGLPVAIAWLIGLLVGILCGAFNGTLISRFKLPPFIVTLGTWSVFGSLNLWYSQSQTIRSQDIEAAAPFLQFLGTAFRIGGARLTYGSILMFVMAAIVWYMLTRTAFGRHIYATGDDPEAARLAGINTSRTLASVYILAGLICAIGGWALIGRIGAVSPQAGGTSNIDSITAVVIGGTSLFGGRGSIAGTLIGALIVGVFRNGLALAGVEVLWQEFAVGLLIIIAVGIDNWIRRIAA